MRSIFGSGAALGNLSNIIMGAALFAGNAATGYVAPAGAVVAIFGANALLGQLHDARKADAKRILNKFRKEILQNWESWVPDESYGNPADRAHAIASFDDVLPHIQLTAQEVAGQRMDATRLADLMLAKAALANPNVYGAEAPDNSKTELARKFLHDLCKAAYQHMIALPEFTQSLAPALWRDLQTQVDALDERVSEQLAQQNSRLEALENLLVASLQASGQDGPALTSGLSEKALMQLAQRVATNVQDPGQAVKELEFAVDLAVTVQRNAKAGRDTLDPVLDRVSHLSADGDFSQAAETLEDALAREEAAHHDRTRQLLGAAIEQDILRGDPGSAAVHILRMQDAGPDGPSSFETLTPVFMEWFTKARDRGLWIDFRIGEELAAQMARRAGSAFERGRAQNFIGVMCHMRGERISGTPALLAAAEAFERAQEHWDQADHLEDWAKAQMNRANSLHALAQREPGNGRIERAITAYDTALAARHRDEDPQFWAQVQMNKCTALRTQSEMTADVSTAALALDCADAALGVRTKQANPDAWVTALLNRAMCLRLLGTLRGIARPIHDALSDLDQTRGHFENDPESYLGAMVHQEVGKCTMALWPIDKRPQDLLTAIHHFTVSLVGLSQDRAPVDRLMTQGHKAIAHATLAMAQGDDQAQIAALKDATKAHEHLLQSGHLRGGQILQEIAENFLGPGTIDGDHPSLGRPHSDSPAR